MRRKYFVHYWANFGNTYNLLYADDERDLSAVPEGADEIPRKYAEYLCRQENERRKNDASFSGFADNTISPAYDTIVSGCDFKNAFDRYKLKGRIWEKISPR